MKKRQRNRRGMGIIVICMLLGILMIPMIGIFTFEYVRATTMHAQLVHATQAAALAGVAKLASSDDLNPVNTHNAAINSAKTIFRRNTINQYPLATAADASSANYNPPANEGGIFVEFLDPANSNKAVTLGDTKGRIVHTVGSFGLMPVFSRFFQMGLQGPFTIRAQGFGEVPDIDIALAFDTSGSIDDQTPISLVHYYWDRYTNPTNQRVRIRLATSGAGRLFDVLKADPDGHGQNAEYIQNIGNTPQNGFAFQAAIRNTASVNGPPGNHPTYGTGTTSRYYTYDPRTSGTNKHYTHSLVNMNVDGGWQPIYPMTFGSITVKNIYEHTALASGWLDSLSNFNTAQLQTCPEITLSPISGAKQQYMTAIRPKIQPIGAAQDAAQQFFTILNTNTDSHFAFTSFNDDAGTTPSSTKSGYRVASSYSIAGSANWPDPGVPMSKTDTKYSDIMGLIPQTIANGGTNIADGITKCRGWIQTGGRPGANGTIVVFTDGRPNSGGGTSGAYSAADACKSLGISVNAIGLAQNSTVVPGEVDCLNAGKGKTVTYTDQFGSMQSYTPSVDGISARGGGAKGVFYLVADGQSLRYAFENLARRLVQIIKVT